MKKYLLTATCQHVGTLINHTITDVIELDTEPALFEWHKVQLHLIKNRKYTDMRLLSFTLDPLSDDFRRLATARDMVVCDILKSELSKGLQALLRQIETTYTDSDEIGEHVYSVITISNIGVDFDEYAAEIENILKNVELSDELEHKGVSSTYIRFTEL